MGARERMLRMRAWRRGIREMDLILGPFADNTLAGMTGADQDLFERLLEENDHDLYAWVTGAQPAPGPYAALIARIARHAGVPGA